MKSSSKKLLKLQKLSGIDENVHQHFTRLNRVKQLQNSDMLNLTTAEWAKTKMEP